MKKLILLTFALCAGLYSFGQGWEVLSETPSSGLHAFDMLDDGLHGMAVGVDLTLITSDGGENWIKMAPVPAGGPNELSMVSADLAWVVCDFGLIFSTTDGGQTWTNQPSGTSRKLQDVQFIDPLNGWAVGGWSDGNTFLVLGTTNGGQTWEDLSFGSSSNPTVQAASFIDAQTGWICGKADGEPFVQKTVDGGNSWVSQVLPVFTGTGKTCGDISFASADIGWATTNRNNQEGAVIYTTDGGTTWTIPTTTDRDINILSVQNSMQVAILGWKVGSNSQMIVKITNDGGLNWVTNNVPINSSTYSLSYVGSSLWLGSIWSRILHSTDLGVNWEYQFTSPYLQSVDWIDDNSAWVTSRSLTADGFTLRTDDGGDNWITDENIPAGEDVFVYDENTAWIMIEGSPYTGPGTLYRTTDGGVTWETTTLAAGYISSIKFISADSGWVYGGSGNIRLTVDGGLTWTNQYCVSTDFVSDIYFINSLEGWLCGGYGTDNGFIRHTVNGGATWTIQNPAATNFLSAIHFFDASNGLAIANGGLVQSTSNGGATWSTISTIAQANLDDLLMLNSNIGWIIGRDPGGHIYRTDDGGQSWTEEWSANLSGQSLSKLALNPSGTSILGCGINNTIVRYQLPLIQPPTNLSYSIECEVAELCWEVTEADSFSIYLNNAWIVNTIENCYEFAGPGNYNPHVTAWFQGIESIPSETIAIEIPWPIDMEPEDFAIENIVGNIVYFVWNEPSGCAEELGFNIYRNGSKLNEDIIYNLSFSDTLAEAGTYTYYATAVYYFGESDPSNTETVVITSNNEIEHSEILVFPNPVKNILSIRSPYIISGIEIINNSGEVILSNHSYSKIYEVDVSKFASGTYFIRIKNEKNIFLKKIFVK